jgi:probable rRNA maturation factor
MPIRVEVVNRQRTYPVDVVGIAAFAGFVLRRKRLKATGVFEIALVAPQRMRNLNRQCLGHDWVTDVITYRYPVPVPLGGAEVVGELIICPQQAAAYARAHGLAYEDELLRYVAHGLLHWAGLNDHTEREQRVMRMQEGRLLEGWYTQREGRV